MIIHVCGEEPTTVAMTSSADNRTTSRTGANPPLRKEVESAL
ncbi:hypothetical protein [Corynebacterium segmentosum]|nr:hypothetical protein [Corynebacterium segmentosum]